MALNKDNKTFVVHIAAFSLSSTIFPSQQTQIALLDTEKVIIRAKYLDYTNGFSLHSMVELPEYTGINDHSIDLINNKQPFYGPIYSLGLVELKTLKTYIKNLHWNQFG